MKMTEQIKRLDFDYASFFENLHQEPELSGQEYLTGAKIRAVLEAYDVHVYDLDLETGLVARIGLGGQPVLALRCDIDALPVEESSGLAYASQIPGRMHACGHDFHTTTVLLTTLLLKSVEASIQGTIKIIFQPAEEINKGAESILATGILDDVQSIFGIHCAPDLEVGQIGIIAGAVTAAVDRFAINILGRGAHAASPNLGSDPIVTAAQLVSAAQSIVSRRVDPFHSAVLSFTHIDGGQTWNVIPDRVFLEGTVRTHDAGDRAMIRNRLEAMTQAVAQAHDMEADFSWEPGPPATRNNEALADLAARIARDCLLDVVLPIPAMIGEDFAYYAERIPACFVMIGTGLSKPLHNPAIIIDQAAIPTTATYLFELLKSLF